MDVELAFVMIKLHYADLTCGQFADKFGLKLNPKDRDFLVGDSKTEAVPLNMYLHVEPSVNVFVGYYKHKNLWYSRVRDRDENIIPLDKMKQILTFKDKI